MAAELLKLLLVCAISETLLNTNEKPTRPPPRKYNLTTKPPATGSQRRPVATAASGTTEAPAPKPKAKPPSPKATKKVKEKPWKKVKILEKKEKKAQTKKSAVSKKIQAQPTKPAGMKPVRVKVKPKTNQTFTENSNSKKSPNSLREEIKLKRNNLQGNGAQKKTRLQMKASEMENPAFSNKTKLSVRRI